MDETDQLVQWLKSEFAAANAIIDALIHHLRATGDFCEYDAVIGCIHQRRFNWTPVIYMQPYFPISEVEAALQETAGKRQLNRKPVRSMERNRGHGYQHVSAGCKLEDNVEKAVEDEDRNGTCNGVLNQCSERAIVNHHDAEGKITTTYKIFVAKEMSNSKEVNVVEGLKLYEDFLDSSDVTRLLTLSDELRASGRRGQLQGKTFTCSRRPMKGHARDTIQLGLPLLDKHPEDGSPMWVTRDKKSGEPQVEAIPKPLEDYFDRIVQLQILDFKPDYCLIDFYNEGDHSHPHTWPIRYGRPVCHMFLSDCDMVFGQNIVRDNHARFKGSLNLSLSAGTLMVMKGKSADLAKHAIPSLSNQRVLLTFGKSKTHAPGPPNRVQPLLSPSAVPYPNPAPSVSALPRNLGPRLVVPGTGVFLPPPGPSLSPQPNCNGGSSILDAKVDATEKEATSSVEES